MELTKCHHTILRQGQQLSCVLETVGQAFVRCFGLRKMIRKCTWHTIFHLLSLFGTATYGSKTRGESNLVTNIWREERQAIRIPEDPGTLYGNERHCINPEPAELTAASTHLTGTWSSILSVYTLDAGEELDTWLDTQEIHDETKNEKLKRPGLLEAVLPILVPFIFAIFLSASVFLIPLLGALGFHILVMLWWVITHPEMKRCGRRTLIMFEQIKRKRQEILLRESMIKATRSRFYLPEFFRLYSDEDVPTELEEPQSDELEDFEKPPEKVEEVEIKKELGSLSGLDVEEESGDEQDNPNETNKKERGSKPEEQKGLLQKMWALIRPGG